MEKNEREILRRNYHILTKNIILTEEFYELLRTYNVLPETMIRDVQAGRTREEHNAKLLELLQIRGCDAFRKLRHVLLLTGHSFLADLLYEEGTNNGPSILKGQEIFADFPTIFNQISDDIKSRLLKYLDARVRERSLSNCWRNSPKEREEIQATLRQNFEQERDLRSKLDSQQRQAKQLTDASIQFKDAIRKRDIEIEVLKRELEEKEKRFKSELSVQSKFNAANNSSIVKLKDRFTVFNGKIKEMNTILRTFLGEAEDMFDNDPDNTKLSVLERNLTQALQVARDNMTAANNKESERQAVLSILGKSSNKKGSVAEIVRRHVEKEEKGKHGIFVEVSKIQQVLKSGVQGKSKRKQSESVTELKHLKALIATVRAEIEHIQKKIQWKDDQITELLEENAALRQNNSRGSRGSLSTTIPILSAPRYSIVLESKSPSPEPYTERKHSSAYLAKATFSEQRIPHLAINRPEFPLDKARDHGLDEIGDEEHLVFRNEECSEGGGCDRDDDVNTDQYVARSVRDHTLDMHCSSVKEVDTICLGNKDGECLRSLATTKTPDNQLMLPDIHGQRSKQSSRQSKRGMSFDLSSLLDTANDNAELEMVVHLLSKKAGRNPSAGETSLV